MWRELRAQCYPVFQDAQGARFHEPLDWKIIQRLAEGIRAYGVTAAFVVAQLESLHHYCLTRSDWQNLARACLSRGQYLAQLESLHRYCFLSAIGRTSLVLACPRVSIWIGNHFS